MPVGVAFEWSLAACMCQPLLMCRCEVLRGVLGLRGWKVRGEEGRLGQ